MSKTTFIAKARAKHGQRYDYSDVVYINSQTKVRINCQEHGPFHTRPAAHVAGRGCPACGSASSADKRRTTVGEFVRRATELHSGKYDYSHVVQPKDNKTKVDILCKQHGPFRQTFNSHLGGAGCPKCGFEEVSRKRTKSFDVFLREAKGIHGESYDYSLVQYANYSEKVQIVCRACEGAFWQAPHNHISQKQGCPTCGALKSSLNRRTPIDEFIRRSIEIHGPRYGYEKVIYRNALTKVILVCPEHGDFEQLPSQHVRGQGCRACGITRRTLASRNDTSWFVEEARKVHGDRFDYSETEYVTSADKVTYRCREHGEVRILPHGHLNGIGCPTCSFEVAGLARRTSFEDFVAKADQVHEGRYTYLEEGYTDSKTPTPIVCAEHGIFYQQPNGHLGGHGCRACSGSNGENAVADYLLSLGVQVERWDREILDGKELDLLLPDHGLAIEYNGLRYHSSWAEPHRGEDWVRNHQKWKQEQCASKSIRLLHYYEDEWWNRKEAVKLHLANTLEPIEFRSDASAVSWDAAKEFLDLYHLQGAPDTGTAYAMIDSDTQAAVMTFAPLGHGQWELTRLPHAGPASVSSLLSSFLTDNPDATQIITYSDNRWADEETYRRLGFVEDGQIPIDYTYVNTSAMQRIPKEECPDPALHRIYNCGLTKWTLMLK